MSSKHPISSTSPEGSPTIRILLYNLIWLLSCIPGWVRFRRALRDPKRAQTAILQRLLRRNRDTEYGRQCGFESLSGWDDFRNLPVTTADDYADAAARIRAGAKNVLTAAPVKFLQPTSGSSSAPKLIPYTEGMAAQFRAALDAWIGDLFLRYPKLLTGRQYWAISPAGELSSKGHDAVPVGFLDDAEYFGARRRGIVERVMAAPPEVRQIPGMAANQYVTLLFLLRTKSLRLISVWHPSFLLLLIEALQSDWARLVTDIGIGGIHPDVEMPRELRKRLSRRLPPMPRRHRELLRYQSDDPELCRKVWPGPVVISCWCDGAAKRNVERIEEIFPHAAIQPKGLMATEGVVSIPYRNGDGHVCAAASHILEFEDEFGAIHPLWEIEPGKVYQVLLTTAGGHYRYRLGDRVEATGYLKNTPCIRFLGRAGIVSDWVGEKIHVEHVENILAELRTEYSLDDRLAVLAPSAPGGTPRYTLFLEQNGGEPAETEGLAMALEKRLCDNFHYQYARSLGQLREVAVVPVPQGAKRRYRERMIKRGALAGTVKFPALCKDPRDVEAALMQNGSRNGDNPKKIKWKHSHPI